MSGILSGLEKFGLGNLENIDIYKEKEKEKENKPLRINFFREHFYKTLESLGMSHKPHDCRKTLSTLMSRQQLTTTAITDILGHENIETTNKFYIKTDKENLKAEMNNIKFYSDESNMTN